MINWYQMTIYWHVDDVKVSHKHPWEVTRLAIWQSNIHGDIEVKRGNELEYLGMNLDSR